MSGSFTGGSASRESSRAVFDGVAPFLLAPAVLLVAITAFDLPCPTGPLALLVSLVFILGVQAAVVWRRTALLGSRVAGEGNVDLSVAHGEVSSFPLTLTLEVAAATALVGPTALVAISGSFGLRPEQMLLEVIGPFLVTEAAFLVPLWLVARCATEIFACDMAIAGVPRRGSGLGALLPVVILPALLTAVGLITVSENAVESITRGWSMDSHYRVARAVLGGDDTPVGLHTVATLTHFDRIEPFAHRAGDNPVSHGIDRAELHALGADGSHPGGGVVMMPGANTGLVWVPLAGDREIGGFRVSFAEAAWSREVLGLVLLAALLAGVAVFMRVRTGIFGDLTRLARRIEGLPGREVDPPRASAAREILELDAYLSRLNNRFLEICSVEQGAIDSGREAREMKTQFFAGLSHDLRSPLNSVIGFTDLLLKGLEGPLGEEQRAGVLKIAAEAEKLMVLVADILDSSKMEAGRFELTRTWVPSVEVLTACVTEARRLIGARPIEIVHSLQPGIPPVYVDTDRIRQAIIGLLARAVSTVKQGKVRLKASVVRGEDDRGGSLRVEIIDRDRVVSAEERANMREAFRRVGKVATHGDEAGMGLGITLAQEVVKLHGGDLEVMGDDADGVIFSVSLPLDEAAESA